MGPLAAKIQIYVAAWANTTPESDLFTFIVPHLGRLVLTGDVVEFLSKEVQDCAP